MDNRTLHIQFLQQGTAGYSVIRAFHHKYSDVLAGIHFVDINDLVNDVFLSLSKTDFSRVQKMDRYVLRAIKLHCWSLLDKAIKQKELSSSRKLSAPLGIEGSGESSSSEAVDGLDHIKELEGMELLVQVHQFKTVLEPNEKQLLNFLIDETERTEIAKFLQMNLNTIDTRIRRLRIKLADYLRSMGYTYSQLDKFS